MDKADKRAAISAYKERKAAAGIFAVRCASTGEFWVGATPTLETIQNLVFPGFGREPIRG